MTEYGSKARELVLSLCMDEKCTPPGCGCQDGIERALIAAFNDGVTVSSKSCIELAGRLEEVPVAALAVILHGHEMNKLKLPTKEE